MTEPSKITIKTSTPLIYLSVKEYCVKYVTVLLSYANLSKCKSMYKIKLLTLNKEEVEKKIQLCKSKRRINKEIRILSFFTDVEKLKYYPNQQANPLHEKEIEKTLIRCKIQHICHPNGIQRFPDFYLPEYNLNVECKSTKKTKPMWNRGIPRPDSIYILTSLKFNKNTFFWGNDVCPEKTYNRLIEMDKKYKDRINKKNNKANDGWILYPRLAFDNKGPNAPNYWNPDYKNNVIKFDWKLRINR